MLGQSLSSALYDIQRREHIIPLRHELVLEDAISVAALEQLNASLFAGVQNDSLERVVFIKSCVLHGASDNAEDAKDI